MLTPTRSAGPARADAVRALLAWAGARGARFDALEARIAADGGCDMIAARPITAGERVVTVPRALMIRHDELGSSVTGPVVPYGPRVELPHDTLAVWLALELGEPASPWRPYLDALPATLPDVPLFRGDDELSLLRGTIALDEISALRRDLARFHPRLAPPWRARVDLPAFTWGRALVRSRAFQVSASAALIPVADLLDHRPGDTRWRFVAAEDAYAIDAVRDLAAGEPVHASYGALGNARLLARYGFALDDNPDDEAAVRFANGDVFVVGCARDQRWDIALAAAGGDLRTLAAAAERGLDAIGPEPEAAPRTSWEVACARVRAGERRVLAWVIAQAR